MTWKQIIKESDDSFIRVYEQNRQHQTLSFFPAEELPPLARHEDISNPPSNAHDWNGSAWAVDLAEYKTNVRKVVESAAKAKHNDFGNALTKFDFITELASFKTQFNNAVDWSEVDVVKDNALAAIDEL